MNTVLITVLAVVVLATSYQHGVQAKPSPVAAAFLQLLQDLQKGEVKGRLFSQKSGVFNVFILKTIHCVQTLNSHITLY